MQPRRLMQPIPAPSWPHLLLLLVLVVVIILLLLLLVIVVILVIILVLLVVVVSLVIILLAVILISRQPGGAGDAVAGILIAGVDPLPATGRRGGGGTAGQLVGSGRGDGAGVQGSPRSPHRHACRRGAAAWKQAS
jgi:uncharacterized protein (DUF58 family)